MCCVSLAPTTEESSVVVSSHFFTNLFVTLGLTTSTILPSRKATQLTNERRNMNKHDTYKTLSQFFNEQRDYSVATDLFLTNNDNAADVCACEGVSRFADTVSGRSDFFVDRCLGGFKADIDENSAKLNASEVALFQKLDLI